MKFFSIEISVSSLKEINYLLIDFFKKVLEREKINFWAASSRT
jgi:hypothetical protein